MLSLIEPVLLSVESLKEILVLMETESLVDTLVDVLIESDSLKDNDSLPAGL